MSTTFPKLITVKDYPGITAKVYRQYREKPDKDGKPQVYTSYTLAYSLLGKRRLESFSDLDAAEDAGKAAIERIAKGEQAVLELTSRDRDVYVRAVETIKPFGVDLDFVAQEWADARTALNGSGTIGEAIRYFLKHRAKQCPQISVADAVKKCLDQCRPEKSEERMHQIEHYLNAFAKDNNVMVSDLTPGVVSRYLTGLALSERTKKNARDQIGFFSRWLVLHGYLERGMNLLEGVQKYAMKSGTIEIFSPSEILAMLSRADKRLVPYIAIGAFAGLRQAEIMRLDWSEVDLEDRFIEVKAENAKTDTRRLVPIQPNLRAWLLDYRKKSGPVCTYGNVVNQLMKLVAKINKAMPKDTPEKEKMRWKRNGLRHSAISYRVADCADVPRVADESGNSVQVIKSNYLKRVKPAQAKEYFSIMPSGAAEVRKKIVSLPKAAVA